MPKFTLHPPRADGSVILEVETDAAESRALRNARSMRDAFTILAQLSPADEFARRPVRITVQPVSARDQAKLQEKGQ